MADVLTNRASFTLAAAITSATQTSITRTSAANGLPGDSNGPASGTYKFVMTDGNGNYEIAQVTGGQGTTTLTIARAVELIGGQQTALASVPSGTVCYAVATAGDVLVNPMTTALDLIVGGAGGVPVRLPAGQAGQVLTLVGGAGAAVQFGPGSVTSLLTTSGLLAGTLGAWVKFTDTAYGPILSQRQTTDTADGSLTLCTGAFYGGGVSGGIGFGNNAGGEAYAINSNAAYNDGSWHLVIATFSGASSANLSTGTWLLYVDSAAVATTASEAASPTFPLTSAQDMYVAADQGGHYSGAVAHAFVIRGTALTASQISALYQQTALSNFESTLLSYSPTAYWEMQETSGATATDASGNGWTGTYTGTYTLGVAGPLATGAPTIGWRAP